MRSILIFDHQILCPQAPPPLPSKTSNGSSSSSWGAPSPSTSAPLPGGYSSGPTSAGGVKGDNDGDRLAAIEAKLDRIMRHLQIS